MAPAVSTQREGERFGQPVESEEERQENGLPVNNSGKDLNAFFHQPFWRQTLPPNPTWTPHGQPRRLKKMEHSGMG